MLTPAQLQTLRTAIDADPVLAAYPDNSDGAYDMAQFLNQPTSPAFIVWKTNASVKDTTLAFNGTEWAGMTSANHTRLQTVRQWLEDSYDARRADIRAMFNDIWSGAGGANTRTALLAVWKRTATKAEKIFASGTGSDGSPANLTVEGLLNYADIQAARNS